MLEPRITYSAKIHSFENYDDVSELYGGTYTHNNPVAVDLRIWNNKYGVVDVEDLKKFNLVFYFEKYEDNALLKFLNVSYVSPQNFELTKFEDSAIGTFYGDVIISGKANNGLDTDTLNYLDLYLEFNIPDETISLKNLDLKSLYMEVVQQ